MFFSLFKENGTPKVVLNAKHDVSCAGAERLVVLGATHLADEIFANNGVQERRVYVSFNEPAQIHFSDDGTTVTAHPSRFSPGTSGAESLPKKTFLVP